MHPIGIFDSGYGGLTVFREIVNLLPYYDYIYLGDNARAPYGTRSFDTIYRYTLQCVEHLFAQGCPLVVLACNTASAKALRTIQQTDLRRYPPDFRVLGVIRPTAEEVGKYTQSGKVGILATAGTVQSCSYVLEIKNLHPEISVFQQACPMWVPLVENGEHETPGAAYFIEKCVRQLLDQCAEIDVIVLGCTHYPLLYPVIRKFVPDHIAILSQGPVVADKFADYLRRHPELECQISKGASRTFLTTDRAAEFSTRSSLFFGSEVEARQIVL